MWMTSCTGSAHGGFLGFWKKSVSWVLLSDEEGWLSLAHRGLEAGAIRFGGRGRWKSQHRKIVPFSPYIEKPLNSKVIKSFVPELRSRNCFSCFRIPMFSVYMLRTFYVRFPYPYHGYVTIVWCHMTVIESSYWIVKLLDHFLPTFKKAFFYFVLLLHTAYSWSSICTVLPWDFCVFFIGHFS